jgi:hypothetical protein
MDAEEAKPPLILEMKADLKNYTCFPKASASMTILLCLYCFTKVKL